MAVVEPVIVSRAEWGAKPPKSGPWKLTLPTPHLILHHSASAGTDEAAVKAIQAFHQGPARGWSDIAYNFLLDIDAPDVDIFEGRGWGVKGGHAQGYNSVSHGICVIGNFNVSLVPEMVIDRLAHLIAYGHQEGYWPDRITLGHRDTRGSNTGDCPGNNLQALIPTINARAASLLQPKPPEPKPPEEPMALFTLKQAHAAGGDGTQASDVAYLFARARLGWGVGTAVLPNDGSWPQSAVDWVKAELAGNGKYVTGNMGALVENRASKAAATGDTGPFLTLAEWEEWRANVADVI